MLPITSSLQELKEELIQLLRDCRGLAKLGYNECHAQGYTDYDARVGTTEEREEIKKIERRIRVALAILQRPPYYFQNPQGLLDENGEIAIQLADGCIIYSGWMDKEDPEALVSGDYIRLEDENGKELLYYGADEIMGEHQLEGRQALGAFLNACAGLRVPGVTS